MPYIKISDPKIIDLPTVHQIINVVNQHSDNISALTNNYGNIYNGSSTSGASTEHIFDVASQQIIYGETTISPTATGFSYNSARHEYSIPVSFIGQPFSSKPFIVAQANVTSSSTDYQDIIVNVISATVTGFTIVLRRANDNTHNWLAGTVRVDWVALGLK